MSARRTISSIPDVVAGRLCLGCGVCAYVQPDVIEMGDAIDHGRRPRVRMVNGVAPATDLALRACPGAEMGHQSRPSPGDPNENLFAEWGPILEVWEGSATDERTRYRASSGGAATAIALHCIEEQGMAGALHIRARPDAPLLNETVLSATGDELLAAAGSRYAPASPCDRLDLIEDAGAPCVFIGKPCDVAAVRKAAAIRAGLDAKLGVTIGIFCAGTPSVRGTLEMLQVLGIDDPRSVRSVRYRGNGWPGRAEVEFVDADGKVSSRSLSYEDSWGEVLQKHRQWRCQVCIDHTGEFADIAVGDPWYREIVPDDPGRSLIVVRTERGRQVLHAALASGALSADLVSASTVGASQPNLLKTRGAVWGRIVASRAMGVPSPRYHDLPSFGVWWRSLTTSEKLRSLLGTVRRILRRGLRRPLVLRDTDFLDEGRFD